MKNKEGKEERKNHGREGRPNLKKDEGWPIKWKRKDL